MTGHPILPFFKESRQFTLIQEGFSTDIKWKIDNTYLLRLSHDATLSQLEEQTTMINAAHALDTRIPFVYDVGVYKGLPYMILEYIEGENGRLLLPTFDERRQYDIGSQVGNLLQSLHSIEAPPTVGDWKSRWTKRFQNLKPKFEKIAAGKRQLQSILPFIESQLYLLQDRPSRMQHYDFHPGNIIIDKGKFAGLIDLQKIQYADPLHEFYKLEYFTVPISAPYARGVIDGYHQMKKVPLSFWTYHRLYAAIHIVSAEVWAHEIAIDQQERFNSYTRFTLAQFDDFKEIVPKWY